MKYKYMVVLMIAHNYTVRMLPFINSTKSWSRLSILHTATQSAE